MNVIYPERLFTRRLSDKILVAFDQACAIGDVIVAHELLCSLEGIYNRPSQYPDQDRRKNIENLVEAHQRLWRLRSRLHVGQTGAPAAADTGQFLL